MSDDTGPQNNKIQAVIHCGVARRLVELLMHKSANVKTPALRTVGNIVTGDDVQTQVIMVRRQRQHTLRRCHSFSPRHISVFSLFSSVSLSFLLFSLFLELLGLAVPSGFVSESQEVDSQRGLLDDF